MYVEGKGRRGWFSRFRGFEGTCVISRGFLERFVNAGFESCGVDRDGMDVSVWAMYETNLLVVIDYHLFHLFVPSNLLSTSPTARLPSKPALPPHPLPFPPQRHRRRRQPQRHKPQQAARPRVPERLVHARRRQRQPRGEDILPHGHGGDGAAREPRVHVGDIEVHRRDDGHDGEAHERQPRRREHPVRFSRVAAGPAVPEQPAREPEHAGGDAERETRFRDGDPVVARRGARVVCVLRQAGECAEGFADKEGQLDEPARGGAEPEGGSVDERDALRHEEDEAEAEGGPEGEGEDDGFGDEEVRGPRDGFVQEGGEGRAGGCGCWRSDVAGFLVQPAEDDCAAGFAHDGADSREEGAVED